MPVIIDTGVDNTGLRTGLAQAEGMVSTAVRKMATRMSAAGASFGSGVQLVAGGLGRLNQATTHMERMVNISGRLNQSLNRMSGLFNSGLGIGATLGGFALLSGAFTRSIGKAREFQTAQIAIAATLQSVYKITGAGGRPVSETAAFQFATQQAQRFNLDIINRQARNILVYKEQLGAFQSALAAGGRKGMTPNEILDMSESAAIVAKTLGLRGEQIANAARLLMGGGVNVGRSTIGRALGISNVDITTRMGGELVDFLKDKMRGFQSPEIQESFGKSIEGIMSTLESRFDLFWAKVGGGFMKSITPALEELGAVLLSTDATRFADTLAKMFLSLFKAIESIVRSPAIPVIMKFVEFLANFGDKIIIGTILLKLVGILGAAGSGVLGFAAKLEKLSVTALGTTAAINSTTVAIERNAAAAGSGMLGGVPAVGRIGAKTVAGGVVAAETMGIAGIAGLTAAQRSAILRIRATQGAITAENLAKGMITRRVQLGQLPPSALAQFGGGAAAGVGLGAAAGAAETTMFPLLMGRGRAGLAPLTSRAGLKSLGPELAGVGSKLLSKALPALLVGAGIELGSSALGLKKTPVGAGITDIAAGGATGAIIGSAFGPMGTAIGAIVGALAGVGKVILDATGRLKNELDTAVSNLAELRSRFPSAAKIVDLKTEEASIKAQMRGEKPRVADAGYEVATGWGPHITQKAVGGFVGSLLKGLGLTGGQLPRVGDEGPTSELTPRTLTGLLERNQKTQKDLKDAEKARFAAQDKATNAAQELLKIQQAQKTAAMGYGPEAAATRIRLTGQEELAQLKATYTGGTLEPSDADLMARFSAVKVRVDKMRAESTKREAEGIQLTGAEKTKIEQINKELKDELQNIVDTQYNRLAKQIPERIKDRLAGIVLEQEGRKAELDIRPIEGEYLRGKIAVQKQVLGQKELLGADYEDHLKTALKNFELMFNKPLKEIEQKISALSLGVDSENVLEAARLAFQSVREKIHQLVEVFRLTGKGLTPEKGRELLAQREEQFRAVQIREAYAAPRRLGQVITARSEVAGQEAGELGALAGAFRRPQTEAAYGVVGQLEAQRRTMGDTTRFEQFRAETLRQSRQDIFRTWRSRQFEIQQFRLEKQARPIQEEMSRMALPQARMGVEQAEYQRQMFEAGLNPRNARTMERAQRIVGREQPRISLGEAENLVREGISLQRRGLADAEKRAKLDEQLAEIQNKLIPVLSQQADLAAAIKWGDLGPAVDDAVASLQVLSDYTRGIVGGTTTPDVKGVDSTKEPAKKDSGMPPINIAIAPTATMSEKDIDQWMPKIREKLCRLVSQNGSRG